MATDVPETLELRARAVGKVVRPHHVITDRTAAWLWGVDTYSYGELEGPRPIETCALRGSEPADRDGVDGRTRDLKPVDIVVRHGIRVTTPLRTGLDLGCHLRRREAYAAMNSLARCHGLTSADFVRSLPRYRRRRGVVQLRELCPLLDPRIESERESWLFLAIHDARLPLPEPQFWIEVDGVPTFRLDFAYPHRRICVEYDGLDDHDRLPEQREHDEERRTWLRDHGWIVIVVRRGDFTGARLDAWLTELRQALVPTYSTRRW